jgi:N-acetylmuramoyl-L-alanine amidase
MVEVGALVEGLGVAITTDPRTSSTTLTRSGREVTLFDKKSLASVNGDLRLLSSAAQAEQGRWYVPLDSVARLLGPLLDLPVSWRPAQGVLVVGNVRLPRVTLRSQETADRVRILLEASETVPFRVTQGGTHVTVVVPVEAVDVSFTRERLAGGIVDSAEFRGGAENAFIFTLGPRFRQVKSVEATSPPGVTLDFEALPLQQRLPTPTPTPEPLSRAADWALRTIVIDPGHGGEEVGAQGPTGVLEKDVTLALTRKLRAALASRLGAQVFLTRDDDRPLDLDERAAIANSYKADLFVSIHANASRNAGARGSEVYFLSYRATDDESRRVAAAEGSAVLPEHLVSAGSDLSFVLWDMAQADHLEESSALASRVQEALAEVTGSQGRGVKQAPFRVLVGAAMPAILIEVAFISHLEEEQLLVSDAFQRKVVAAISQGIAQYEGERARRLDPTLSAWKTAH